MGIPEEAPPGDAVRDLLLAELRRCFRVSDVDASGFTLERLGIRTRVPLTAAQVRDHVIAVADGAWEVLGVEPRWRSGVGLLEVHIGEEAAMAETGMRVIQDGPVIRREPPPRVGREDPRVAPGVAVREIGADDWELWRPLRQAALAGSPGVYRSTLAEWTGPGDTEARWRDRLRSVALNLVLEWEGEPAGLLSATAPDAAGTVWLISMWVAPDARGHGVADSAIARVAGWARNQPGRTGLALTVAADNRTAIRLYERNGFRDAGPDPEHPDERVMRRSG